MVDSNSSARFDLEHPEKSEEPLSAAETWRARKSGPLKLERAEQPHEPQAQPPETRPQAIHGSSKRALVEVEHTELKHGLVKLKQAEEIRRGCLKLEHVEDARKSSSVAY